MLEKRIGNSSFQIGAETIGNQSNASTFFKKSKKESTLDLKLEDWRDNYLTNIAYKNTIIKSHSSSKTGKYNQNSQKRMINSNALSSDTNDFNEILDIIEKVNPDDYRKNKSSSLIR